MSHIVQINSQFTNIETLKESLKALNWVTVEEKTKAKTYPSDPKGNTVYDYVARNPNPSGYDIGINWNQAESRYDVFADMYAPGQIAPTLGNELSRLKQTYAVTETQNYAQAAGYAYETSEVQADGSINVCVLI